MTILDPNIVCHFAGVPGGIGLETIAGNVMNLGISNYQPLGIRGDNAVCIFLVSEGTRQKVMDEGVSNNQVLRVLYIESIHTAVTDFKAAKSNI